MNDSSVHRRARWKTALAADGALVLSLCLGILTSLALLGFLFSQIASEGSQSKAYRLQLEQSIESRWAVRSVLSALLDAETGQRGYLLSGNPEFLDPYRTALLEIPARLENLLRITSGTPTHGDALRLRELALQQLRYLRDSIDARMHADRADANDVSPSLVSKKQMDSIRQLVETLLITEQTRIDSYSQAVDLAGSRFERLSLWLIGALAAIGAAAPTFVYANFAERRRLTERLRDAMGVAEKASAAKSEFLATMSHEIRTPLNGVIGYSELLMDEDVTTKQRQYLERIRFAGEALLTIVNDILDFSKIEAGRLELVSKPFLLEPLLDNIVSIIRAEAERKDLNVVIDLSPHVTKAGFGDEARLRQVLLNLLSNAVKFTDAGTVTLAVDICSEKDGIRFEVRDTGRGIPAAEQERIFQRFMRVSSNGAPDPGGTGLGLAISKHLVSMMGGRMGFESREHIGSSFWFELPVPPADPSAFRLDMDSLSNVTRRTGRILLVEDLEHNRELARTILQNVGHSVDVAPNGEFGVAAARDQDFDLILMDIQMPVMDGLAATGLIRELSPPRGTVPILAMSANVLPHHLRSFRAKGMNDHVGKPFTKEELLGKVQLWLGKRGAAGNEDAKHVNKHKPEHSELQEWRDLMGDAWMRGAIEALIEQIDDTFEGDDPASQDPNDLARRAHALISHASVVGYRDLATIASSLEEACRSGSDAGPMYVSARQAALAVRNQAADLLQDLQT